MKPPDFYAEWRAELRECGWTDAAIDAWEADYEQSEASMAIDDLMSVEPLTTEQALEQIAAAQQRLNAFIDRHTAEITEFERKYGGNTSDQTDEASQE